MWWNFEVFAFRYDFDEDFEGYQVINGCHLQPSIDILNHKARTILFLGKQLGEEDTVGELPTFAFVDAEFGDGILEYFGVINFGED